MATLLLTAAVTQFSGLTGWGLLGAQFLAGAAGAVVDTALRTALTPTQQVENQGPRLSRMSVMSSAEGSPINRLHGTMRMGGQLIWSTQFVEKVKEKTEEVGGKGGGGQEVSTTTYSYSVSFAVAFCEGNTKTDFGRVWFDGQEIDVSRFEHRFYKGSEAQDPDPLIQSVEGVKNTPAFRGVTYLVFEDMPLARFGNRIPQVTAEIIRPVVTTDPDDITNVAQSFCVIPASGEFVYGTEKYRKGAGKGDGSPTMLLNVHNVRDRPDFIESMRRLEIMQSNLDTIALVVGWFGDDLRISNCDIRPKVEANSIGADVTPEDWTVDGLARVDAQEVSRDDEDRPIYGGTPSDEVVKQAIAWLKDAGYRVVFYPFIFMDITEDNTKPNPYSDNAATDGQPAFPWRGRITCSPAAGYAGTVDKTATAETQVDNFFDKTWGFRRFILHYANLCVDAGGVDAFLIGSEMVGMTQIRSGSNSYPAVPRLRTLAGDVRAIVGSGCKIGYAADWSEYHSHRPNDGSGDVYFNLDPLWMDDDIDFVGIDNYLPVSDWRDGDGHLDYDAAAGIVQPHNLAYLKSNIEGGEYFDWYYASDADRENQVRTPIVDSAASKHWVFRQKDIRNWWANGHVNRPAGVEDSATAWTAEAKPIWFTEYGCPAIDKGTNQPNVFVDPKSSESFIPHFSSGVPDEAIQRAYVEAFCQYWRDEGGDMIAARNMLLWCWDARPYPAWPGRRSVWSDGDLWKTGHWLNGRLELVSLKQLISDICKDIDLEALDFARLAGANALVRGYTIDSIMAVRDMITPLMTSHHFDLFETAGLLAFAFRDAVPFVDLDGDSLVMSQSLPFGYELTRRQETDLPDAVKVSFVNANRAYNPASVDGKRRVGGSDNVDVVTLPEVLGVGEARSLADNLVQQAWAAREHGSLLLPPSRLALEPGDGVRFNVGSRSVSGRLLQIETGEYRSTEFAGYDPSLFRAAAYPDTTEEVLPPEAFGDVLLVPLDIPMLDPATPSLRSPRLTAWANPWPGEVAVYEDDGNGGWSLNTTVSKRGTIGELRFDLYAGAADVWDDGNQVYVQLYSGTLGTLTEAQVLKGANALAVQNADGAWEILQFVTAELTDTRQYTLSRLLRGRLGTEHAMRNPVAAGARVVYLDNAPTDYFRMGMASVGETVNLLWGPAVDSIESDSYSDGSFTFNAVALRPYAPVHLAGAWSGSAIMLTWTRRTRFDGDDWEPRDVPLNEDAELYDLEILSGITVVRTVEDIGTAEWVYSAAMQAADFGGPQISVTFRVYQISAAVGRGTSAAATVSQ
ncbi:MAG: glycoside hydrolase/phage tail family protein [Rhizobium sp.]|nr:glycoside hydrolase/phage tail family protein [Rhizobium sp.]